MTNLFEKINNLHKKDPVIEIENNQKISRELLYCKRMVNKLKEVCTEIHDYLLLSAMCHHLCRWEVNREKFPKGRPGYNAWRREVYNYQAHIAKKIMQEENIEHETRERVLSIIKKENLKDNKDAQLLEDIACTVFIEFYLEDFSKKYSDEKLFTIIKKTLKKMSPQGHKWLENIKHSDRIIKIINNINAG